MTSSWAPPAPHSNRLRVPRAGQHGDNSAQNIPREPFYSQGTLGLGVPERLTGVPESDMDSGKVRVNFVPTGLRGTQYKEQHGGRGWATSDKPLTIGLAKENKNLPDIYLAHVDVKSTFIFIISLI